MKTDLPRSMAFDLAQICAERVHVNLINLHSDGCARAEGKAVTPSTIVYWRGNRLDQVRQVVTSIEDKWDRCDFVSHLRHLFKKMRDEKGTIPTTRAYVARVLAK